VLARLPETVAFGRVRMIELAQIQEMFARIAAGPGWDLSKPMRWGYFFIDRRKERLEQVVPLLEQRGYRFVALYQPEQEHEDDPGYYLHVERDEVHSPESLHVRNIQLEDLAEELDLDAYDGMDVGLIV
jgi:hypothetical protein